MSEIVGIVACSNPRKQSFDTELKRLYEKLKERGEIPIVSDYIYDRGDGFAGSGEERAKALIEFYEDEKVKKIYDISGGDIANEILPYLDFNRIASSEKKILWIQRYNNNLKCNFSDDRKRDSALSDYEYFN